MMSISKMLSIQELIASGESDGLTKSLAEMAEPQEEQLSQLMLHLLKTCKANDENSQDCLRTLLRFHSNPDKPEPSTGQSPLMLAVLKGDLQLTHILLSHNAKVNHLDAQGQNALFYALQSQSENVDIFTHLIDNGAEVDCQSHSQDTLLTKALEKEYFQLAEVVLSHSTKHINTPRKSGDTPLHLAVQKRHKKTIETLVRLCADGSLRNNKKMTPLEQVKDDHRFQRYLKEILQCRKDKEKKNFNGNSQFIPNLKQLGKYVQGVSHEELPSLSCQQKQQLMQQQMDYSYPNNALNDLSSVSVKFSNPNKTLDISDILNQSNTNLSDNKDNQVRNEKQNGNKVVIFIDMSTEDSRQIIRKEAELESQNKFIRETQQQIDGLNEEITTKTNLMEHFQSQLDELTAQLQTSRQDTLYLNQALTREQEEDAQEKRQAETEIVKEEEQPQPEHLDSSPALPPNQDTPCPTTHRQDLSNELQPQNKVEMVLHKEIIAFYDQIQALNTDSDNKLSQFLSNLNQCVQELSPNYQIQLYGSYANQLYLPSSEIDTVIVSQGNSKQSLTREQQNQLLQSLMGNLQRKKWIKDIKMNKTKKLPSITVSLSQEYFKKRVHITVHDQKHNGIEVRQMISNLLSSIPQLKYMVLVMKQLLCTSTFNQVSKGGLSSYALVLFLAAYIQFIQSQVQFAWILQSNNYGVLFIQILYFYLYKCDYRQYYIYAYDPFKQPFLEFPSFSLKNYTPILYIIDPLNPKLNVTSKCFQFPQILKMFSNIYVQLFSKSVCQYQHSAPDSEPCCILKRIFHVAHQYRKQHELKTL